MRAKVGVEAPHEHRSSDHPGRSAFFWLDRCLPFFTRNAKEKAALSFAVLSLILPAITSHGAVATTRLVVTSGPHFPNFPDAVLSPLGEVRPVVNARGDVAFVAPFTVGDGSSFHGLFVEKAGFLEAIAVDGPVPGFALPVLVAGLRNPVLNSSGEVLIASDSGNLSPLDGALSSNVGGLWRVLAREGDPVPDRPGEAFDHVPSTGTIPLLRADGPLGTAFQTSRRTLFPEFRDRLWIVVPPSMLPRLVLESGGAAPGLTNGEVVAEFAPFQSMALSPAPAEILAISGRLQLFQHGVDGSNGDVVWAGPPLSLRVIARSGQPVPPPAVGRVFTGFGQVAVNAAGQLAIVARGTSSVVAGTGILTGTTNDLALVVRAGDPVPDRDGLPFGLLDTIDQLALNASGQIVFKALVRSTRPNLTGSYSTLYRWTRANGLTLVARQGETWPGAPAGWTLQRIDAWNLNARGQVAFHASAAGAGPRESGTGLWLTDDAGEPVLLAQARIPVSFVLGALAPDIISLAVDSEPSGGEDGRARFLSDRGEVAFATAFSDRSSGIHVGTAGAVDQNFTLTLSANDVEFGIHSATARVGYIENGRPLDREAVLAAHSAKDWSNTTVRFEIAANAGPGDRLGIMADDVSIDVTPDQAAVQFDSSPIGTLSYPASNAWEVRLNTGATTTAVRSLLRTLAYGLTTDLEGVLQSNPRHVETNRVLRLRITDAAGRTQEATRLVQFPRTVGLALTGVGPNSMLKIAASPAREGAAKVCIAMRLSDATRLSLPSQSYLALGKPEWLVPGFFSTTNITFWPRVTFSPDTSCASFHADTYGSHEVEVTFLDWREKFEIKWEPEAPEDDSLERRNPCLIAFVEFFYGPGVRASASLAAPHRTTNRRRLQGKAGQPAAFDLLANPYGLRGWMRGSAEGRRLVELYERHSPELVHIVSTNSALLNDVAGMLGEFMPGLNEFLAGKGTGAVIRLDMVEQVNRIWDAFAAAGSTDLKAAIATERARFNGLQDFAGRSFGEWGRKLGWGTPASPFITLSSPRREAGRFSVEANYVAGMEYVLQRASALRSVLWEPVTNSMLKLDQFKIELTDPTAGNGSLYYRLQARESRAAQ
ncbi:MAG: hypothetical protein L0Z50_26980 [Verrucomicrobiales bacterium]|nr:hypothetical protein [Verrucomicrobiales bacterium]